MIRPALATACAVIAIVLLVHTGCSSLELVTPDSHDASMEDHASAEAGNDGATRLTTPPAGASDQNPAFAPDTAQMVFTRFNKGYNSGPAGLFLLDLGSGGVKRLTPVEDQDNVNLPGAAWSGAKGRIVFASDRLETDDVWHIAADGTDLHRITTHSGPPWYIEPSWSPDGRWIVFEADNNVPDDQQQGSVWKVRDDGSGLTVLPDGPGSGSDNRQPNWSPAGGRIVFQRRTAGSEDWNLYTMATDGSDIVQVTDSPASDTDASWSPDGACIVYSSDHGELAVPNLFVVSASGGTPTRITYDDTHEDSAPSWSPDGKWIAFESHEGDWESPTALWRIAVPEGTCESDSFAYTPLIVATSPSPELSEVNDFLYQLQNLDLNAVGDSAYDLVIMDYSAGGDDATAFTSSEIAALRQSPGGEKIVLAYMSIGEAEDYRFYWDERWDADGNGQPDAGAPAWLDSENPDWQGNYKVRYWDPAWQTIIFSYTQRLLDAGFEGAYLDIIDAYGYYEDGRSSAAQEMADFVAAIRGYARARDADFLIFPQNAPELAEAIPAYLSSVDGIGQEDIYYGYEEDDVMTSPSVTTELEGYLDLFENAGKLVLTVDYATTAAHIDDAYTKSVAKGYVPFVTVRDLDQLTIHAGHEPD